MFTFNIHISLLVVFVAISETKTLAARTASTDTTEAVGHKTTPTYSNSNISETSSASSPTSTTTANSTSISSTSTSGTLLSTSSTSTTPGTSSSTSSTSTTPGTSSSTSPTSMTSGSSTSTKTTPTNNTSTNTTPSKTTASPEISSKTNTNPISTNNVISGGTTTKVTTVVSSGRGRITTMTHPSKVPTKPKPLECYEYTCQNESCLILSNVTCSTADTSCFITNTYVNGSVVNTTGGCSNGSNCSTEQSENSQSKKTVCCLENQCNTDELFKPNSTKSNGAQTHTKPSYDGNGIGILRAGVSSVVAPVIWIALSKVYVLF